MTPVSLPPDLCQIHVEGLMDLYCDVIRLAVHDARRGPGRQAKTRSRYNSALDFLDRLGMLERVAQLHGIDLHTPRQYSLLDLDV